MAIHLHLGFLDISTKGYHPHELLVGFYSSHRIYSKGGHPLVLQTGATRRFLYSSHRICSKGEHPLVLQTNRLRCFRYAPQGGCKCIWPPKWVLMIMTRTIKELMCLLSYEQDVKSLKLKRASIDAKFAKGSVHELH